MKGGWDQKKEAWKEQIDGLYQESNLVLKDKKLIVQMLMFHMVKVAVLYVLPWLSLVAVGTADSIMFGKSFVLASLMLLMTNAIPHIAGMGPTEYMFLFIYGFYVSEAGAASAMLLYRAATYFLPFLISLGVVLLGKRAKMLRRDRIEEKERTGSALGRSIENRDSASVS